MKPALALLALAALASRSLADERLQLSPDLPYSAERGAPVEYDVEFVVTITATYKTKKLCVGLPIPPSDRGLELLSSELSSFPAAVEPGIASEPMFGNKIAFFEFAQPQGADPEVLPVDPAGRRKLGAKAATDRRCPASLAFRIPRQHLVCANAWN